MELSPDATIIWQRGPIVLNATILYSWIVMGLLVAGSWAITRQLSTGRELSRWQNVLEALVVFLQDQIRSISQRDPDPYLPFIGTLFLFIAVSNLLGLVPTFQSPAGSLSTTGALAFCVFVAIPAYGIAQQGMVEYLKHYVRPAWFMLPFEIVGEISRTLALALRLFGNTMSGHMIIAILVSILPLFLPLPIKALELLVGLVQAYIFAILSMVYIASALQAHGEKKKDGGEAKRATERTWAKEQQTRN